MSQQQKSMRVIMVLSDSVFFQPQFVFRFLSLCSGDAVVRGIVLTGLGAPCVQRHTLLLRLWHALGFRDFVRLAGLFISKQCTKLIDGFCHLREPVSIKCTARRHGIDILRVRDINSGASVSWIRERQPDVLISGCFQIFKEELLAQPRLGSINRHCSLLPEYRGLFPAFWAKLDCVGKSGVSVHLMNGELDGGSVLSRLEVPWHEEETLYHYVERCYVLSADLVWGAIVKLSSRCGHLADSTSRGRYYSCPDREDVARFRAAGHRIL